MTKICLIPLKEGRDRRTSPGNIFRDVNEKKRARGVGLESSPGLTSKVRIPNFVFSIVQNFKEFSEFGFIKSSWNIDFLGFRKLESNWGF